MSYVPPYRRPNLVGNTIAAKITKQEHREQFPCLQDKKGNIIKPKQLSAPTVDWKKISYEITELQHVEPIQPDDGWVNLSTYEPTPDTMMTTAQLLNCAEQLELNWRRYYTEHDIVIPSWITNNPYDNYEDFDRTIPYSTDEHSDSESESSVYDEDDYLSDQSV
jgi:hypothetical protein